ncbi:MAG: CCA tRNA nucleotidyltransferase [Elusimicrobia bacterium]|nr:CCA tRNA nucleotidyltransferase [Elusimicrobiota bacterium]
MTQKLLNTLKNSDVEIWLVGGALRNHILKKPIKDLDFSVKASIPKCANFAKSVSKKLKAPCFPLDEERGIWRISLKNAVTLDFSPLKEDIKTDLMSRDFTVNSFALPVKEISNISLTKKGCVSLKIKSKTSVLDYCEGFKDIEKKRIRTPNKNNFKEDPLRLLRAFRFAAELGFSIDKKTLKEIKSKADLISSCAKERIKEELLKIFATSISSKIIQEMKKSGLLFQIFPQLKEQETCAEIYYGKGGVLKHTINVLKRADLFFSSPLKYMPAYKNFGFKQENIPLLKLAALLHDIAKPSTAKEINGRLRFFGHEEKGAAISYKILKDLKFSNEEIRFICRIIGQHLRIGNIAHSEVISQKAMFKIFSDLGESASGLIILSWTDHASYISEKKIFKSLDKMKKKPFKIPLKGLPKTGFIKTLRFIQVVNLIAKNYSLRKKDFQAKSILDGNEIMKILSIPPGPKVGEIIRRIKFIQFQGKIKTKKEAESYIKTLKI